jgi:hypothetical protein
MGCPVGQRIPANRDTNVSRLLGATASNLKSGVKAHLGHSVLDHFLAGQIALVTNEQLVNALDGITVDLLQPLLDVGEGV